VRVLLTLWVCLVPLAALAQLEIMPPETPATVFAGRAATIKVLFHNPTDAAVETEISTRLFQASSATVVPLGEVQPWKKLRVLPKQTVLESFDVTLPSVKGPTRFQIQWTGLGKTDVIGYPLNQLKRLQTLADEKSLAVFDPDNQLKPLLKQTGVKFTDYEVEVLDGRLALVWSAAKSLPESVLTRVNKGMAAVWIRPEKTSAAYVLHQEAGIVVIVPQSTMARLSESPLLQLNLIHYAELALEPDLIRLPEDRKESE
jgi:hypothetical protein